MCGFVSVIGQYVIECDKWKSRTKASGADMECSCSKLKCGAFCLSRRMQNACWGGGFFKGDASPDVNASFINTGEGRMLEGKDFEDVNMVFPFVALSILLLDTCSLLQ